MTDKHPILVVGPPRSGTTWIGEILSADKSIHYIFEPDNEKTSPLAWLGENGLHRFPYLTSQDNAEMYREMWGTVISGDRKG